MSSSSSIPLDTTLQAARVQIASLQRLNPAQRARIAFDTNDQWRKFLAGDVRQRHQEYSGEMIRLATARLLLGDALFRQVYGSVDVRP